MILLSILFQGEPECLRKALMNRDDFYVNKCLTKYNLSINFNP